MKLIYIFFTAFILISCQYPRGPVHATCLKSDASKSNTKKIKTSVIKYLSEGGFNYIDHSDGFAKLENNIYLIRIDVRPSWSNDINLTIVINGSRGESVIYSYGWEKRLPEVINPLIENLKSEFLFTTFSPDENGFCGPAKSRTTVGLTQAPKSTGLDTQASDFKNASD